MVVNINEGFQYEDHDEMVPWSGGFGPPSEGMHHAVVDAVQYLGRQPNFDRTGTVPQSAIRFEIVDEEEGGKRLTALTTINHKLHAKSKLGKILKAAGLLPEPGVPVKPSCLLGANLMVQVERRQKEDRIYANLVGFAPLSKSTKPVEPNVPVELPDWITKKMVAGGVINAAAPKGKSTIADAMES